MLHFLISAASLLRRATTRLAALMGYLSGWGFIGISCLITFDVLARKLLGFSTQATTELSGYALAFGISWGLAHTLAMRAHVRIDLIINKFPAGLRYWLHLMALVFLGVFIGFVGKGGWDLVDESLLFRATDISVLRVPLAIPQGLWLAGILVMLLLIVCLFVESLLLVLAGRGAEAEAMLSSRTYDEEAAEALHAVGADREGAK